MLVVQGRVFVPDLIPYRFIITTFGTNLLKETFGFRDPTWNQESGDYVFQDGTFEHEGAIIPVTWLGFNERRIAIQVLGSSAAAHALYISLCETLAKFTPFSQQAVPLVFNEETSCTVQLNFEWPVLLNPVLVDQISRRAEDSSTDETKRFIKGVSIRFTIGAATTAETLGAYDIQLFDQTIAIEPKVGVPLSERIYFTYSPYSSDAHLRLVSELESSFAKRRRKESSSS